ncbi:hypothetical protein U1Q18_015592, partial [Sarracenia purpurea var. burkii]
SCTWCAISGSIDRALGAFVAAAKEEKKNMLKYTEKKTMAIPFSAIGFGDDNVLQANRRLESRRNLADQFWPENLYFICLKTNDLTEIESAGKKRIGFWNILDGEEEEICGNEPRRGRLDDVLHVL